MANVYKIGSNIIRTSGGSGILRNPLLVDGGTFRVSGSGFGSNSAVLTILKPSMEAASAATPMYNFSGFGNAEGTETGGHITQISTSSPLYGTKCFVSANDGSASGGLFGVNFDTGANITSLFLRDYVRLDHTGSANDGQWKMLRFNGDGTVQDSAPANMYIGDWYTVGFDFVYVNSTGDLRNSFDWGTTFGTWYEREVFIVPGTQGGSDGRVDVRFRAVSDFSTAGSQNFTTMQNYNSANRMRYIVFHNYQGNNSFGDGSGTTTVRMDGLIISNGSAARVYFGNASTLAACSKMEWQPHTSWSGTDIYGTVVKGVLSSLGSVWAYVFSSTNTSINSSGIVPTVA